MCGNNINFLIEQNILTIPNYIKIDVDGIEFLILRGANKYLSHKNLKEILIELNEHNKVEFNRIKNIKKIIFNFIKNKEMNCFHETKASKGIYNYIFKKNYL